MATRKNVLGSASSLVKNVSVAAAEFAALRQKVGWYFWNCRRLRSTSSTAASISVRLGLADVQGPAPRYDALRRSGT